MCSFLLFDLLSQVLEIFVAVCGVCDDIKRLRPKAGDDSVVNDTTSDGVKKAGQSGVVRL